MKKGFTLAEIMIVLAVIGVLTAILLPVAINSSPNEDIMKFKKGHNALLSAIRELVNSDKYYLDGDLGIRANGTMIDGTHDGDVTYFCETLGDIINSETIECSEYSLSVGQSYVTAGIRSGTDLTNTAKTNLDKYCKEIQKEINFEIKTPDKISFYQQAPNITFGTLWINSIRESGNIIADCEFAYGEEKCNTEVRIFSSPNGIIWHKTDSGFDSVYKIFCMDIDEIDEGEDPFGYGIRADGKVLPGARADEWLQKSIQEKE